MNNLGRGIILVVGRIFIFSVVILRPEFLKSVRRIESKYHLSRLGTASCGVALLAIGIAGILNGLAMLSGVYVQSIIVLAITQLLAVGFYDTYRKSRLGCHSPFNVDMAIKRREPQQEMGVFLSCNSSANRCIRLYHSFCFPNIG
jgi:hypothetical protein